MSFRSVFVAVVIAFGLILSAFLINFARPKTETKQPTADFVRASGKCAECHARLQYAVVHDYELSVHAENGFFMPTEWIPVISSAFASGFLIAFLLLPITRKFLDYCVVIMIAQALVGIAGFWFHVQANLIEPGSSVWDRLVNGAPPLVPLLFSKPRRSGAHRNMVVDSAPGRRRLRSILARNHLRLGASACGEVRERIVRR